jgi:hypothetical protein
VFTARSRCAALASADGGVDPRSARRPSPCSLHATGRVSELCLARPSGALLADEYYEWRVFPLDEPPCGPYRSALYSTYGQRIAELGTSREPPLVSDMHLLTDEGLQLSSPSTARRSRARATCGPSGTRWFAQVDVAELERLLKREHLRFKAHLRRAQRSDATVMSHHRIGLRLAAIAACAGTITMIAAVTGASSAMALKCESPGYSSGSVLQQRAQNVWLGNWETKSGCEDGAPSIFYDRTSSGAGLAEFGSELGELEPQQDPRANANGSGAIETIGGDKEDWYIATDDPPSAGTLSEMQKVAVARRSKLRR